MIAWSVNDDLFKRELEIGYAWQCFAASFFACNGLSVYLPPMTYRKNLSEAAEWTKHDEDMKINGRVIEVKSRRERFTHPDTFPYETAFVDTVSGYEAKDPKPIAYVFVSQSTGSMVCVSSETASKFSISRKHDRVRGIDEDFYTCPRSMLRTMDRLVAYLRPKE